LACSSIQPSWARCMTSGRSAAGWASQSKSSSVLGGGKGGVANPLAGAGGVAGEHLGLEQSLEELLVGPLLGAGPLGGLLEPLEHPGGLQLVQQVGQALAELGRVERYENREERHGQATAGRHQRPPSARARGARAVTAGARPSSQAQGWSSRDRKRLTRTFPTLAAAKAWRHDAMTALCRETLRAGGESVTVRGAWEAR
jgi:hypothetical protein